MSDPHGRSGSDTIQLPSAAAMAGIAAAIGGAFLLGFLASGRAPVVAGTSLLDVLGEGAEQWLSSALAYSTLLAAVGTAAMALLELIKALGALRRRYHRFAIRFWFATGWGATLAGSLRWLCGGAPVAEQNARALAQLIDLGAGGADFERAWYDQPAEDLFSQVRDVGDLVLDFPSEYRELARFFGLPESDSGGFAALPPDERERYGHRLARRIESLRSRTKWLWARLNQIAAMAMSALLLFWIASDKTSLQVLIVTVLLGGLLAPFAKDFAERIAGVGARVAR